jgi:hypothetical protein
MRATSFCYCFYPLLTVGNVAPAYKDINMIYITTLYFAFYLCFAYFVFHSSTFNNYVSPRARNGRPIEIPSRKPNPQIKLLFTVVDASEA